MREWEIRAVQPSCGRRSVRPHARARGLPVGALFLAVALWCPGAHAGEAQIGAGPVVWLFPAVGRPDAVTVRGRVLREDPDHGRTRISRNLRSMLATHELGGAKVRVKLRGVNMTAQADDEGFFACTLPPGVTIPLGVSTATAFVNGDRAARGQGSVSIVRPRGLSVISDLDDTIAITGVTSKRQMLATALLADDETHPVVPGMATLYRCLTRGSGKAVHYLSGTPVGLLRRTQRFLDRHRFPRGAILLRHLDGDSLDPVAFKLPRALAITRAFPDHRFVLVGDDGEKDPEVYAQVRMQLGDRVRAVFIRRVNGTRPAAPRLAGAFLFDRASQAATEARRLGLIDQGCTKRVARDERLGR